MSRMTKILSALIALAMLLTGAAFAEATPTMPAQGQLTLGNITVDVNGESVTLNPALHLNYSFSDESGALVDFRITSGDDVLFPVQVAFNQDVGATLLFANADTALRVPAEALNNALSNAMGGGEMSFDSMIDMMDGDESVKTMLKELVPAYIDMLKSVQDPAAQEQIKAAVTAAVQEQLGDVEIVDTTFVVNGEEYEGKHAKYTLEAPQLVKIAEAELNATEAFSNFWEKYLDFLRQIAAESDMDESEAALLNDPLSVLEKAGIGIRMDVEENATEDQTVASVNMVTTVYKAEGTDENLSSQIQEFEPAVVYINAEIAPEYQFTSVSFGYELETQSLSFDLDAVNQAENGHIDMKFMARDSFDDEVDGGVFLLAQWENKENGDKPYTLSYSFASENEGANAELTSEGILYGDGAAEGNFGISASTENNGSGSFSADYFFEPYATEDIASTHEAFVLDKLDEEGMQALQEDQGFQGAVMKVAGSVMTDAQKLTQEESVVALVDLFNSLSASSYDVEEGDEDDNGYQEPEDDGELPYEIPEFTYVPDDMSLEMEVDTAYDTVDFSLSSEDYSKSVYVYLYKNDDTSTNTSYVVGEDGALAPVEGRVINMRNDTEYNYYDVNFTENGVYVSMSGYGDIDAETMAQIAAGIQW